MLCQIIGATLLSIVGQQMAGDQRVAVVNVARVSEQYLRTADLESQFESKRLKIREEGEAFRQRIEQKRRVLAEQLKPGSEAFRTTRKELAMLEAEAQYFVESKTRELDEGLAKSLYSIYDDIRAVVRDLAKERGYLLVMAADQMPEQSAESPNAAKQQILLNKVVYWDPRVDITDEIIARLNSRYGVKSPGE